MKARVGELNKHSTQFGGSKTAGGQVQVHHTVEGDRRNGRNDARGCVSPLGGVSHQPSGDQSPQQESRNRAQSPRSGGPLGRFHGSPDKPI